MITFGEVFNPSEKVKEDINPIGKAKSFIVLTFFVHFCKKMYKKCMCNLVHQMVTLFYNVCGVKHFFYKKCIKRWTFTTHYLVSLYCVEFPKVMM